MGYLTYCRDGVGIGLFLGCVSAAYYLFFGRFGGPQKGLWRAIPLRLTGY